jgi:DNA-binding SARP family transcriptional activator
LAAALWGEEVPRDLVGTVRVHVSRLRRVLAEPEVLETTPAGYRLAVQPGQLDAERFRTRLAEGRAAVREQRHEEAAAALREALEEWRGAAVAEFALEPFARAEAAELEELRLTALEARFDAELELGRHAALTAELRALTGAHPLRERLQAQLMLALYRAGRQAEALDVYRAARTALVEELGIEPGAELRELERAMLRQDPALNGHRPQPATPPLPDALGREVGVGLFVGRTDPLERLRQRWELARAGERQFVLLAGEPGIGKTRLASELGRDLHNGGATVLYGRSDPDALVPYQPLIGALGQYVGPSLMAGLAPELRELARFLPALQHHVQPVPVPGDDPQAQRYRLHEAVARVLAFAARERPTLLALDDLHWADTATGLALAHVLGHGDPARLLIVGMVREDGERWDDALADLLARRRREPAFTRIDLRGLDVEQTGTLAGLAAGDGFAALLRERTDGNPLFIHELLRSLSDGEVPFERALLHVPEGVKETIERRLVRLGETAEAALGLAAVQGREFRFDVLEALLDVSVDDLLDGLEEALSAKLVREIDSEPGRFLFAHALVQDTLYERQSQLRRMRAHDRIGAALSRLGGKPAEIARHFYIARSPESTRYSVLAAREAATALAYEEAAEHYRRALERLDGPDDRERCELLLALAAAGRGYSGAAARETYARAAELARRAGLTEQLAQAALGFPHPYMAGGLADPEAVALLEEALSAVAERDDPLVAKLLARLANVLHFHADEARVEALSRQALAMARRAGDPDALVMALESCHSAHFHVSYLDERLTLADELLALARRIGARDVEALAQLRRTYNLLESGDVGGARSAHRELTRLAAAVRSPLFQHVSDCMNVVWALSEDRVADAGELAEKALQSGLRADADSALADHHANLVAILYHTAGLGQQVDAIRAAAEASPHLVAFRAVLCHAQLLAGDVDAARDGFEALAGAGFAAVPRDMLWLVAMGVLAQVSQLLNDRERAATLYALMLPYRERYIQAAMATCWGSVEHYLGLLAATLGDAELAAAHFGTAAERNEASGLRHAADLSRQAKAAAVSPRNRSSVATVRGAANP